VQLVQVIEQAGHGGSLRWLLRGTSYCPPISWIVPITVT
jgi:hypothetical protein